MNNKHIEKSLREVYDYYIRWPINPYNYSNYNNKLIGAKFELSLYSNRWDNFEAYVFTMEKYGWHIKHAVHSGNCNNYGLPVLVNNFKQDSISYPVNVFESLAVIHQYAHEKKWNYEYLEKHLYSFFYWINVTEYSTVSIEGWN